MRSECIDSGAEQIRQPPDTTNLDAFFHTTTKIINRFHKGPAVTLQVLGWDWVQDDEF